MGRAAKRKQHKLSKAIQIPEAVTAADNLKEFVEVSVQIPRYAKLGLQEIAYQGGEDFQDLLDELFVSGLVEISENFEEDLMMAALARLARTGALDDVIATITNEGE